MAGVTWRCWTIISLLILITSYAACDVSLKANNQSQEFTFFRFGTSRINETETIIITATDDLIQLKVFSTKQLSDQACAEGSVQIYTGQARLFHGTFCGNSGGAEDYFSSSHPVLVILVNTTFLPVDIEIYFRYEITGRDAKITPISKPRFLYTSNYPAGGSLYNSNKLIMSESYGASDLSTMFIRLKYADVNYKPVCALTNVKLATFHGGPNDYTLHKEHVWCGQEVNTFSSSNSFKRGSLFSSGQKLLQSGLQIMIWTEEVQRYRQEIATTADTTVIQSPGFPYGYPQRMNCRWYVNLRQNTTYGYFLVSVDVVDIDCERDILEILYLNTGNYLKRKRIGCENGPLVMDYYTDYLLVWFVPGLQNTSGNHTGFNMTIQRLNETSCYTELIATDSVQKLSPNVTASFHRICKWVIRVSNPVMAVKIHIKNYPPWCQNQQNRIYDGPSEYSYLALNNVCGNGVYQSTTDTLKIVMTNMTGTFGEEIEFWQGQYSRNITDSSGTITYPSGQGNYKSGVDVTWTIRPSSSQRIVVYFSEMDVNCGGDAVFIRDGERSWSICGSQDRSFLSRTHSLVIIFKSTTDQGKGFVMKYYDDDRKECGDSVIDVHPIWCWFNLPKYDYFDNLLCKWRIMLPANEKIKLTITVKDIKTTSPPTCEGDYLQVYDEVAKNPVWFDKAEQAYKETVKKKDIWKGIGEKGVGLTGYSESSPALPRVCGANKEVTLESSGNLMYVEFITDSVLAGTGFEARCSTTHVQAGDSTGVITGIIVVILFVLTVGCGVFCCIRSSRRRAGNHTQTATPLSENQTQTVSPPFSEGQTQTAYPPPSYDELSPSSNNGLSAPPPTYNDVVKKAEDFQINSQTVTSSL